ncbi:MAG TPA: hypothetical protein VLE89_04215 [Chlamydiales bacterium]|nr:hypothetical protein [Chlamydiales bacterium]
MKILFVLFIAISSPLFCKPKLSDYQKNIYSQFGEDGIIEKIFELIGTTSKIAIEFGAADGFECSNTANFWAKDSSWLGVLIESDVERFDKLVRNTASYSCIRINKKIGISEQDSLEAVLEPLKIGDQIDLLSIDIDGNDFYIMQSLEVLRPRVIVCEYNVSMPAHLDIYPEPGNYLGCSVAALQRVASEKGYSLVAITVTNCIFVRNDEFPKFSDFDTDREHIRIDDYICYVISDYAGSYHVIGRNDYKHAWGWSQKPSTYPCYGSICHIPSQVTKKSI